MPNRKIVPLNSINFNNQDYIFRISFDTHDLETSLKEEGLLYSPILVKDNDRYKIVCGYRRLNALKNLKVTEIECIIYDENELDEQQLLKISIMENTKRKNLKPIEISKALKRIKNTLNYDNEQLANTFGEVFNIKNDPIMIEKYINLDSFESEEKKILYDVDDKIALSLTDVKNKEDRHALVDILQNNKNIKMNQFKKILDTSQKLNDSNEESKGLKNVFEENSLQDILKDNNLTGAKKITNFIHELEHQLDPKKIEKTEQLNRELNIIKEYLKDYNNMDLSDRINIKKKNIHEKSLSINLEIENIEEFKSIIECIYKLRSKLNQLINL